jgi:hypothetical protein
MGGSVAGKAGLRIAYSNHKAATLEFLDHFKSSPIFKWSKKLSQSIMCKNMFFSIYETVLGICNF